MKLRVEYNVPVKVEIGLTPEQEEQYVKLTPHELQNYIKMIFKLKGVEPDNKFLVWLENDDGSPVE